MEKNTNQKAHNVKKPSYEELNGYVNELMMENRNLRQKLNQIMDVHNKLPYLFEILKSKELFEAEYIEAIKTEIQILLPPFNKNPEEATETINKN